jgi:hypothetical protein
MYPSSKVEWKKQNQHHLVVLEGQGQGAKPIP